MNPNDYAVLGKQAYKKMVLITFIFYIRLTTILVRNCAEPAKAEMLQYGDVSDHYSMVDAHTNKYVKNIMIFSAKRWAFCGDYSAVDSAPKHLIKMQIYCSEKSELLVE
ncbi:hypothetical protein [Mariprofundus sp. EBB-1]|uniref:hypothetical protein n=1 Tax=Mariprofundus sp. EBB-1 TaxID=2650971 RepID=UPI0011C38DDC|nr:hypothetical protein [Mariprofundus sp. EBB-1]